MKYQNTTAFVHMCRQNHREMESIKCRFNLTLKKN